MHNQHIMVTGKVRNIHGHEIIICTVTFANHFLGFDSSLSRHGTLETLVLQPCTSPWQGPYVLGHRCQQPERVIQSALSSSPQDVFCIPFPDLKQLQTQKAADSRQTTNNSITTFHDQVISTFHERWRMKIEAINLSHVKSQATLHISQMSQSHGKH